MFEELKKISFRKSLFLSVILLIAGAALCLFQVKNAFFAVTGYVDFTDLAPDEIKDQLVDVELWESFGCYMESGSENTSTHSVNITNYNYIIYTGGVDDVDTEFKYMSIQIPAKYQSRMETLTENTYNGLVTSPISFSGKIKKLDSEEYGYFEDFWREAGFTSQEIEELTLPYYIDVTDSKGGQRLLYIALFLGGLTLMAWGVFRIIKAAKGGYLNKFRRDIASIGCTEYTVESDFRQAASYAKKDMIRIGRLFTYYNMKATEPRAIPNTKIMWAYQSTTTHRTNGIKTGTTYAVTVFADGYKSSFNIPVPNEAAAQQILQKLDASFPWIIVGYSEDLQRLFHRDRDQFLQLKYNTAEHNTDSIE